MMSRYRKDRTRIWTVGVRQNGAQFSPTSLRWFGTRKECQEYIDQFRSEYPAGYSSMEHKPMCYYPAGESE